MSRYHHRPEHKRGWDCIRKRAIAAAGRRCSRCGLPGRLEVRLEVHHPTPLSHGGDNGQVLEVLCRNCHFLQHNPPDPARRAWAKFLQEEFAC